MCGLTGFTMVKPIDPKPCVYNMFSTLFIMSQLRGVDSSGISINWRRFSKNFKKNATQNGWLTYKARTSPYSAYACVMNEMKVRHASDKKKNNFETPFPSTAIAHARAATKGGVTADNAHPFSFGNNRFIGVHNGTINNSKEVLRKLINETPIENTTESPRDYLNDKDDSTDSEIVLYCIYRYGIEKVYPFIEGAWAFVFFRQDTNCLYFIRNSQRPLHILWSYTDDVLFWSSEEKMIEFAAKRGAYTTEWVNGKHTELPVHTLFSIELRKDLGLGYSDTTFPWSETKKLEPKYSPVIVGTGGSYGYHGMMYDEEYWDAIDKEVETKEKEKNKGTVIALPTKPSLPAAGSNMVVTQWKFSLVQNKVIPIEEWLAEQEELKKKVKGAASAATFANDEEESVEETRDSLCCWCAEPLTAANEHGRMTIKGTGTVCGTCANNEKDVESICDAYSEAADDPKWIARYLFLTEKKGKRA